MLDVRGLTGGYGNKAVLESVSFGVNKGELFGILGPNGSGKTTLLSMLSGVLDYKSGSIRIRDMDLKDYSSKQLAQVIAVLPQHSSLAFSYTVKETVSLGRYAHQTGWFHSWTTEDEAIVQRVMQQTGVAGFQDFHFERLSGGERQRVLLAQALAQEPEILFLDEPTNHLDLSYQKELLDLMRKMAKEQGLTVISIFHDLNLAGLYCDRLMLLEKGQIQVIDVPNEVLQQDRIQGVYQTKIEKHPHPALPKPQMFIVPEKHSSETIPLEIDASYMTVGPEMIQLDAPIPLRTMSSGVTGSGTGWHRYFVNRHVHRDYNCEDHHVEMADYLRANNIDPQETVGMMTAVFLDSVECKLLKAEDFSVFIVVTAGVGNAIDASLADQHSWSAAPGTINTWIFVNGHLAEEAFIHSIVTATEAKVKALHDLQVLDKVTNTCATGTSTDSILIAAAQRGPKLQYAGTITPLGKLISRGVYDCIVEAIKKNRKRIEEQ
ncbi:heme ABC transporter ATP-binding protein [Peribacillus muralis]|uniref:heme ABC transporter ATP-binding protein n=1 Tax=Peribacillus muralis TaxID=264697 RepID=UPI001F4DB953|nr:heme ABC transporter ATP-binding protein [Peribacillus muralis]MCK1994618.1 heme ABC transporter ATP-binding protein [Peribacillus muralis]MCK2015147.1 heme ABC transporter ATP-binding protein [Peribacillus muralis]